MPSEPQPQTETRDDGHSEDITDIPLATTYSPEYTYSDPQLTPLERRPSFFKVAGEQTPSSCPAISKIPLPTRPTTSRGHLRRQSSAGCTRRLPSRENIQEHASITKLSEGDQSTTAFKITEPQTENVKVPSESGEAFSKHDKVVPQQIQNSEEGVEILQKSSGDDDPKVISRIDLAKILEPSSGDSCVFENGLAPRVHATDEKYQLLDNFQDEETETDDADDGSTHQKQGRRAKISQQKSKKVSPTEHQHGDVLTMINQELEAERKLGAPKSSTVNLSEHYLSVHHHQLDGKSRAGRLKFPTTILLVPTTAGRYVATLPIQNVTDKKLAFKVRGNKSVAHHLIATPTMGSIDPKNQVNIVLESRLSLLQQQSELIEGDTLLLEITEAFPNVEIAQLFQIVRKQHPNRLASFKINVDLTLDPLHPEVLDAISDSPEIDLIKETLNRDFQCKVKPIIEMRKPVHEVAIGMESTRQTLAQFIDDTRSLKNKLDVVKFCLLGFVLAMVFYRFSEFGIDGAIGEKFEPLMFSMNPQPKEEEDNSWLGFLMKSGFGMKLLGLADFMRS